MPRTFAVFAACLSAGLFAAGCTESIPPTLPDASPPVQLYQDAGPDAADAARDAEAGADAGAAEAGAGDAAPDAADAGQGDA